MMQEQQTILDGYSDLEKGAYLGAISSIATADSEASAEEIEHISVLCDSAGLSGSQKQVVIRAATELTGAELNKCLDILKTSDLKHSLIADMIAFAKSDNEYNEAEQKAIQNVAQYLGINQKQFSLLDEFAEKATHTEVPPQNMSNQGFMSSLGLEDKMRSAGINTGSLLKGLIGIAAPLMLAGMFSGSRRRYGGGMFGGGSMMGGGMMGGGLLGGGLGSLIGMLAGGRGYRRSRGFLGGIFGF